MQGMLDKSTRQVGARKEGCMKQSLSPQDMREAMARNLHVVMDPEALVLWMALVTLSGDKELGSIEKPSWFKKGISALIDEARKLEDHMMWFLKDEKTIGTLADVFNSGLAEEIRTELREMFGQRKMLEMALKAIEDHDPDLAKAWFDLDEVFSTIDGLVEASPRSFIYPAIVGWEILEGHPWSKILEEELKAIDRETAGQFPCLDDIEN